MPTVFTLAGASTDGGERCKAVRNRKTGCTVMLCPARDRKTGRKVMRFKKGTTRCPGGRR